MSGASSTSSGSLPIAPSSDLSIWGRPLRYLRRHPVLLLLLFSPGIPEYLSGSSALAALVLNPGLFLFQLVANLGLYGPGVLLIREALVRNGKSWPSLLAWGCAYAILEEGVALSTMFNPNASVVGVLGSYGHFAGVSWVWALGLSMVHTVFSISLPIVLLGLTLPETRAQPFLTRRGVTVTATILAGDVSILAAFVFYGLHFWMGAPILLGSLALIAGLIALGWRAGPSPFRVRVQGRSRSPAVLAILGALLFSGTITLEGVLGSLAVPAFGTFAAVALFYVAWAVAVLPALPGPGVERRLVALSAGLLAPILAFGLLSQLYLPIVLLGDVAISTLLIHLWRAYRPAPVTSPMVPAGARGAAE
ncbi:MAG TPA: hypothetical protein VEY07_04600 [Thermoplasmata archaeon]|nr:hypothetical protein [Thermoplasmata archaeon]